MMDAAEQGGEMVGWAHQQAASSSGNMLMWKNQSEERSRSTVVWQK